MVNKMVMGIVRAGRAAVSVVGLAVVLALVLGAATTALAGTGVGATFNLGKVNSVSALSTLVGSTASSMLKVDNNGAGTALDLQVGPSTTPPEQKAVAPMTVDSQARVANLNADKIDGKDSSAFAPASGFGAAEVIDTSGAYVPEGTYTSKGGTLVISASGSGFRSGTYNKTHGRIGMSLKVDGVERGRLVTFTNEMNSHRAFVADQVVVKGLPAGTHEIKLEHLWDPNCAKPEETSSDFCTYFDGNDFFRVTVLELPG